jgi:nucleotide-binding universal stress UspA family protein
MMSEPRIIVGVDNSDGSDFAVRWAAEEAVRTGRELVVINAYEWRVAGARGQLAGDYAGSLRRAAEEVVERAVQAATGYAPGVNVRGETAVGSAGAVLTACTAEDLVVVGNRGRGGFATLMLGSVGHHVAVHTKGTVVIVRGRPDADRGPVVVGFDEGNDALLRRGFEEAQARHTSLLAVHAYQRLEEIVGYGIYLTGEEVEERHTAERRALRDAVEPWASKYPDVPVETLAVEGQPSDVLTGLSRTAQVVVVGHRAGALGTGLGAVAAQLLHHAECPVMVTRSA